MTRHSQHDVSENISHAFSISESNKICIFLHSMEKKSTKVDFSPIYRVKKSTILHSKWTHLKSCCVFLISLRSIINLAHDFKCPFLDIEITISCALTLILCVRLFKEKIYRDFWNSLTKVISISRNGHLKSCARFIIERSEIRKKQHDFKCVHFECRMVLFYMIWEKSRL